MANPYHDETGKFCERDEMRGALKRLAQAQNINAYFALQSDFDAIEEGQRAKQLSKINGLTKVMDYAANSWNEGYQSYEKNVAKVISDETDPEAIRAIADRGIDKAPIAIALILNDNTPEDIRKQAADALHKNDRVSLAGRYVSTKAPIKRLLLESDPENPELIDHAIASSEFSSEEALELSKKTPRGFKLYLSGERSWVNTPEFEAKAMDVARALPVGEYSSALTFIAENASSATNLEELEASGHRVKYSILRNPNTSAELAQKILLDKKPAITEYRSRRKVFLNETLDRYHSQKDELAQAVPVLLQGRAPTAKITATLESKKVATSRYPDSKSARAEKRANEIDYELKQAEVDSYEKNNQLLTAQHERNKVKFANDELSSAAYTRIQTRVKNAKFYQQFLGDTQALKQ